MPENYKEVQSAVNELLKVSSTVKRRVKTESEKKLDFFVSVMNMLEDIEARSMIAQFDFDIDLSKYDEKYMDIIDTLLYISYGKECYNLISFYRFERINHADGSINPIIIEATGEEVFLENPYDLYNMMRRINSNIE
jgi:hypothetical protein